MAGAAKRWVFPAVFAAALLGCTSSLAARPATDPDLEPGFPVQTYETRPAGDPNCGSDTPSFLTDVKGFFLRITPYEGPATYRARWIKADGKSEYGVTIPIG